MERLSPALLLLVTACSPEPLESEVWRIAEESAVAPCAAVLAGDPEAVSGEYEVAGGFGSVPSAFCNMNDFGGGWTLVGKVRRFPDPTFFGDHPRGFWQSGHATWELYGPGLGPPDTVEPHGLSSHAASDIRADEGSVVWFELVHASGANFGTSHWFKGVTSYEDLQTWFIDDASQVGSKVCRDPELTQECASRQKIVDNGEVLRFEGMALPDGDPYGLHMRLDGHVEPASGVIFRGVCTSSADGVPSWPATNNLDGHWGNGLRIWIR